MLVVVLRGFKQVFMKIKEEKVKNKLRLLERS
jgi:hypothetical protein